MDILGGILSVVLFAILISALFYYALKVRGPWGNFWVFFLILVLSIWAASLWIRPIGPTIYGVSWVPLFFIGLLIAILLAAIPTSQTRPQEKIEQKRPVDESKMKKSRDLDRSEVSLGWVFWLFVAILLIIIIVGYANT